MAKFKAVARVKTGTVVTGYDIENEKGQRLRIDRTYMCYLVGQGLMEDITGAIYKDSVVLKGNLNQLPVVSVKEKPEGQNTVRALVKDVRTVVGAYYEGNDILIPRDVLEQDALSGKLTNLDAQRYKGKVLFKGCRNLPVEQVKHEPEVEDAEEVLVENNLAEFDWRDIDNSNTFEVSMNNQLCDLINTIKENVDAQKYNLCIIESKVKREQLRSDNSKKILKYIKCNDATAEKDFKDAFFNSYTIRIKEDKPASEGGIIISLAMCVLDHTTLLSDKYIANITVSAPPSIYRKEFICTSRNEMCRYVNECLRSTEKTIDIRNKLRGTGILDDYEKVKHNYTRSNLDDTKYCYFLTQGNPMEFKEKQSDEISYVLVNSSETVDVPVNYVQVGGKSTKSSRKLLTDIYSPLGNEKIWKQIFDIQNLKQLSSINELEHILNTANSNGLDLTEYFAKFKEAQNAGNTKELSDITVDWQHENNAIKDIIYKQVEYLAKQLGTDIIEKFSVGECTHFDDDFDEVSADNKARIDIYFSGKYSDLVMWYETALVSKTKAHFFLKIQDDDFDCFEGTVTGLNEIVDQIRVNGLSWR